MKQFAALLACLGIFALTGCNDTGLPDPTLDTVQRIDLPPYGEPPVWSVSDEDTTIYFFGTVHILKPETEWKTDALIQAFDSADAVYFEADVASAEATANMARLVPQLGMLPSGEKLTALLDEDELKEVEEAAALVGMPVAALDPLQPWLATVQLSAMALQKQGYSPDSGVETVLTELAETEGLELRFLETAEEQLRFFADLPIEDQVEFLVVSAQQIEDEPTMLDDLVREWAEGDVDDLAHLMAEPDVMGSEAVYDSLIVARNTNWTRQIKMLMEDEAGSFFIAVGAAHLAGEDSVIAMLRADGYAVEGP